MLYIPFGFIIVVGIIAAVSAYMRQRTSEKQNNKKLDKVGSVCNIILSIFYVPLSWFSWLLFMASEATINATNQVFITLIHIFCWITLSIPFLCILGIVLSVLFRKKGYSVLSLVVQFLPLLIFGLNIALLTYAETLPPVI